MTMGTSLGSASYGVTVDTTALLTGFAAARSAADKSAKDIVAAIGKISQAGHSFKLNLAVDTKGGEAAIKNLQKQLGSIKSGQAINLTLNGQQAEATLARLRQSITAAERRGATIEVRLNTAQAQQQASNLSNILSGSLRGLAAGSNLGGGLILGGGFAAATGAAVAVQALTSALVGGAKAGVDYNTQLLETMNTFQFFSKNAEDAAHAVAELRRLAVISPASESQILQSGATFLRVSQGDVDRALELTKLAAVLAAAHPEVGFEAMQAAIQQLVSGDFRAFEDRTQIAFGTVQELLDKGVTGMELYRQAVLAAGGSMALMEKNADGLRAQSASLNDAIAKTQGLVTKGLSDRLPKAMEEMTAKLNESEAAWRAVGGAIGFSIDLLGKYIELATFLPRLVIGFDLAAIKAIQDFTRPPAMQGTRDEIGAALEASGAPILGPRPPGPESDIDKKARLQREGDDLIKQAKRVAAAALEAQEVVREGAARGRKDQLEAAADQEKAELKAIDAVHRARLEANRQDIDGAERAKDAAIKAAQERHDAAVDLIEAETAALARARELEDRGRAQTRQQEDRDRTASRAAADSILEAGRGVEDRVLDARREVEDRALDDRRTAQDQAFDDERDAALKSLKDQEEARSRSVDAEIKAIERRKTAALRALDQEADKARDSAQKRIRAIEDEAEADVRGLDQRAEAARDSAAARLRGIEDSSKATLRALDEETEAARDSAQQRIRAIDEETEAARDSAQQRIRAIDEQERAEDKRHQQAMDNLAAEEALQLGAIDDRLKALDTAERLATEAERDAELAAARDRAGRGLAAAIRVGDPAAVAAARKALAEADAAIAKERAQREQDATRRGLQEQADAIRTEFDAKKDVLDAADQARKESADAEQRLIQDVLASTLDAADAEQQQIQDVLAAHLDALDKRKQAIQDTADAEQRQIQDVLASTLDSLDKRKQAVQDAAEAEQRQIQDSLAKHLDALDRRKLAIQDSTTAEIDEIRRLDQEARDAYDAEVQRVTDEFELRQEKRDLERLAEDRALADGRKAEDVAIALSRKAEDDAIAASHLAEDQAREDNRLAEDNALADGRNAQNEDIRLRREAADDALKAGRDAIDLDYNGPDGILTLLRKATADINEEHRLQAESVREKYDLIRDMINARWDAVVAHSQQATRDIETQLKKQVEDWGEWGKGSLKQINAVIEKIKALIRSIQAIPGGDKSKDIDPDTVDQAPGGPGGGTGIVGALPPGGAPGPIAGLPWEISFPFDAPYNGAFAGGAAWPGGPTRHRGVDLILPGSNNGRGTPYGAFRAGTVIAARNMLPDPAGNGIIMQTDDGLYHAYFHNDSLRVKVGDRVEAGQTIATLGGTGTENFPHVHFEVRKNRNGDPVGSAINPMPYMTGGIDQDTNAIKIFGRYISLGYGNKVTSGLTGMALIDAIEKLGTGIRNQDFGLAGAAIAHSEGAAGDLTKVGDGGSWGPFQFHPGGELRNYAKHLGFPVEQAGPYAGMNPMNAADWALRGYLGNALNAGIDEGIRGAPLADYGSRVGQRPAGELWRKAGDSFRQLYGYANGGPIPEPTWLVSQRTGLPYAEAGEDGPEDVVPRRRRGRTGGDIYNFALNAPIFGVDHLHAEMDRAFDRNERRKQHERTVRTR